MSPKNRATNEDASFACVASTEPRSAFRTEKTLGLESATGSLHTARRAEFVS